VHTAHGQIVVDSVQGTHKDFHLLSVHTAVHCRDLVCFSETRRPSNHMILPDITGMLISDRSADSRTSIIVPRVSKQMCVKEAVQ